MSSLMQQNGASASGSVDVCELNRIALGGLVQMLVPERQLFCYRLVYTNQGFVREGISPRYTIMTLLGLHKLESVGLHSPFDLKRLYESLVRDTNWVANAGDLGLLIWLTAKLAPDWIDNICRSFDLETTLNRYPDARQAKTMELAWFLAGLSHMVLAFPGKRRDLEHLALRTYRLLDENKGKAGFFGHQATEKSAAGLIRGRIGSFADQVYPIYAMSKCAIAFHLGDAANSALECATAICEAQGDLGQWWWLYDALSGKVVCRYPVYSVHQDGMAPMALLALEEATNRDFSGPIYKGLRWIGGENERHQDLRDLSSLVIWRCLRPKNFRWTRFKELLHFAFHLKGEQFRLRSQVVHECRPYELGWFLYAFA